MKKEFYAPAKFKMSIPDGLMGVSGGLIFPSGIPSPTLVRRDLTKKYPHLKRRFLDPQLYLAALPAEVCRKACVNLASYGWFLTKGLKAYESAKQDQSAWKREAMAKIHHAWTGTVPATKSDMHRVIAMAVQMQGITLDCAAVILPSPLTHDLGSDYSHELNWLDMGLNTIKELAPSKDSIATIALSDTCLRGLDPWKNDLLSVIIDQITARMPDGVYIAVEQSNEHGYFCTHFNTIGSLLRLVHQLKEGGIKHVVVGPCGMAGLLALTVGADAWSAGWYRGERRIKLTDYEDQMGMAIPTYYSHSLAGEIHLEKDLDRLNKNGMLKSIADETTASKGLLQALRAGHAVKSVPEWEHRKSNVTAATEHFFMAAVRETEILSGKDKKDCLKYAHEWLRKAEGIAFSLYGIGAFNPRTELNHQASWLKAFDSFLVSSGEG